MTFCCLLATVFTIVELNCENLFDTQHDSLKNDYEFLPDAVRHWDKGKYWRKLNNIGKTILACGEQENNWQLPDLVALSEVENDTVMRDLTLRSQLRSARYEYVMTQSADQRGIDVALLYSPSSFALIGHYALRVEPVAGRSPTRDILYVAGTLGSGDTLHVFVVHAPSRAGGESASRPYRLAVAQRLCHAADSIRAIAPEAMILVAGDFNDYSGDAAIASIENSLLAEVSRHAMGSNGARATYRYKGEWGSLDHIFASPPLADMLIDCRIFDAPFLLEDDTRYGGVQPRRTYRGMRYNRGFSDHLPLVARFRINRCAK